MTLAGPTPQSTVQEPPFDLSSERTCSCPPNHINCMTAKEWLKSQIGVRRFAYNGRDIRDKEVHPAVFPLSLASHVISLFTHQGELVVDPFVGSGTTLVAAQDLERNAIGADLSQAYVDLSLRRLGLQPPGIVRQAAIVGDARNLSRLLEPASVKLIFTSPPYANLLNRSRKNKSRRERRNGQYGKVEQYSQDARDLGTLELDAYTREMAAIFASLKLTLKPGSHCVVNVPDMWWDDERITLHVAVIEALRSAGYELRNTIIWDRTNIVNSVGIFGWPSNYITMGTTFEYLLHFRRPPHDRA